MWLITACGTGLATLTLIATAARYPEITGYEIKVLRNLFLKRGTTAPGCPKLCLQLLLFFRLYYDRAQTQDAARHLIVLLQSSRVCRSFPVTFPGLAASTTSRK